MHKKIFRDIWLYLSRSLLVILAIAISVFGAGFALSSKAIIEREIEVNAGMAGQPSATLWLANGDAQALKKARRFPGLAGAESRRLVQGRIRLGPDTWRPIYLSAADDFNRSRIGKIIPESGQWPPPDGKILIERSALSVIGKKTGDTIVIRSLGRSARKIKIAGTVYDPSLDTPWVSQIAYGYISKSTLKLLTGSVSFNELRLVVSDGGADKRHVQAVAGRLGNALEREGYTVDRIDVPEPGKHPAADRVNSFVFLVQAFSLAALALSGALTATIIAALLSRQIRQIGIMKALGARTHQIMGIYFGTVLFLSSAALAIAVPLSTAAGRGFAKIVFKMLSLDLADNSIPLWIYIAQIALGIVVPILAAAYPIYRGSRISIREALGDYGVSRPNFGAGLLDHLLGRIRGLSRPLALSLRNTFRRRGRLFLTIVMLTVGGASFIASIGTGASLYKTVDDAFARSYYDAEIRFDGPHKAGELKKSMLSVEGVAKAEAWGYAPAFIEYPDGTDGDLFQLLAPPARTTLIEPLVVKGRWLRPKDTNAIVLNTRFMKEKPTPDYQVGDLIVLNLNSRQKTWRIVGVVREIGKAPAAYVNYGFFAKTTGNRALANSARIALDGRGKSSEEKVFRALEAKLAGAGFKVASLQPVSLSRQVQYNHIVIQLVFLTVMSVLIGVVGALGLASTMNVNVSERIREIGIMRSIGASTGAIARIVIAEGVVIGLLSWIPALAASIPLTKIVSNIASEMLLKMPLTIVIPFWAPLAWLAIVIIVAIIASLFPALSAARLTVREVLAYE